jgi:phage terminase large subunit
MSRLLLDNLDRLIDHVENGADLRPHADQIRPEWRLDMFKWARERLKLPMHNWAWYAKDSYRNRVWDGTPEPLWTMAKEIGAGRNVAVSSATGVGKTFAGALMLLWFLDCFEGSQVITLAPKEEQLTLHIWKEVGRLWDVFHQLHPQATLTHLKLRMRPRREDWAATGFACGVEADEQVAGRARGFHAEDMMFIFEETTGIHNAILNAVKLTCTAPHNLRLYFGNPDSEQDSLARVSKEVSVRPIRASAYDHPNVVCNNPHLIPGACSKLRIDEWREELGDESPIFQSRARGIPPPQSADALVRREWVERAMQKTAEQRQTLMQAGPAAAGLDVAYSEHGDKGALCWGRGAAVIELWAKPCPDPGEFARHHLWPLIDSDLVKPKHAGIDMVGVGAAAMSEMKRLGAACQGLNGGRAFWEVPAADDNEHFKNLRSQMWWQARKDLMKDRVSMPHDEELIEDLILVTFRTLNGAIIVESKEDLKKRLGRSPDKGDAFVYWNWIRQYSEYASFGDEDETMGPVAL